MISAMDCRANSQECGRLAREAATPSIRTGWTNMARTWIVLAGQIDRIEILIKERRQRP
jgi:hypothetical protein